jgi:hypothetical protein
VLTKAVETTRLPESERPEAERRYEAETHALGRDAILTKMLTPAVSRVGQSCRRHSAQTSSLLVLVAVERYRLKHRKWPDSLEALKPGLLKDIPLDPFDGKPIRYRKVADGVVVYSVGYDGNDDGGNINRSRPQEAGVDLGYRLWDVKARRQPALEALPEPEVEDGEG